MELSDHRIQPRRAWSIKMEKDRQHVKNSFPNHSSNIPSGVVSTLTQNTEEDLRKTVIDQLIQEMDLWM
jgi:hypothetical protein